MTALRCQPGMPPPATRLEMALDFEMLGDDALTEILQTAIIDHGGTYVPVLPGGHWGPVEHEISLLGVCASGHTPAAAARNWVRYVLRMERARQQGAAS